MQIITEATRPKKLIDYVLEKDKKRAKKFIDLGNNLTHLLFYGEPGTGKTTLARVIAQQLLIEKTPLNYLELNASMDRGIDTVRTTITNFVKNAFHKNFMKEGAVSFKIIVLDEADSMTNDCQEALRSIIETYSENARFIFCCNDYSKLNNAIKSRCKTEYFERYDLEDVYKILKNNLKEHSEIDEHTLYQIVIKSKGDLRKAFSQIPYFGEYYESKNLKDFKIEQIVPYFFKLFDSLTEVQLQELTNFFESLKSNILDSTELMKSFSNYVFTKITDKKLKLEMLSILGKIEYLLIIGCLREHAFAILYEKLQQSILKNESQVIKKDYA